MEVLYLIGGFVLFCVIAVTMLLLCIYYMEFTDEELENIGLPFIDKQNEPF